MTEGTQAAVVKLVLLCFVLMLFVCGYVFWTGYTGRKDVVVAQRAGCERGKLDRSDNADFQRAQRDYINQVVLAQSVQEDVKAAAREAVTVFERTSVSLTERSVIDCAVAFPKAKLIP